MDLPRQSSSVLHRNTFVTLAAKPTSSGYHCLDRTLLRQRAPVFHTPNQQSSLTSRLSWSGVARAKGRQYLSPPERKFEVDDELWSVLDICSDQELEDVHKILFGGSLLSPLVKSLVADNEPPAVGLRGRTTLMHRIENRFRFLAADSGAMLRGYRPSYREALLRVRDRLHVPCPGGLATQDLESEIFLYLLQRQAEAVQGVADSIDVSKGKLRVKQSTPMEQLGDKWAEIVSTMQMGAPELGESLVKLLGAVSVTGFRQSTLRQLGQQLLMQRARYQTALNVVCRGTAPVVQREASLRAAQAGLTNAAARFGTVSGALSLLGPAMWTWLAADLALKSIGTDYGRLVKAIYTLAQIRLLRTHGFINPT